MRRLESPAFRRGEYQSSRLTLYLRLRNPKSATASAVARVTRAVRLIERQPEAALTLGSLARQAGLSPYHFLRTFEHLTGVTPHQYVLRARLREAAMRLAAERARVLDIALDCGFGDVSNFNHAFRTEFGVSPRIFRQQRGCRARTLLTVDINPKNDSKECYPQTFGRFAHDLRSLLGCRLATSMRKWFAYSKL